MLVEELYILLVYDIFVKVALHSFKYLFWSYYLVMLMLKLSLVYCVVSLILILL